ncbi:MAG TPA: cysteine desulfurase family protein [Thermoanaerobaculia bacterium]|jgi:cysteine desulfurase|nr:cysteine desulfurase family protein [Thermoanaerobaculia bacterium]
MQRIYVDNNATTPVHPDVLRVVSESLATVFGNASSIHKEGQTARRAIEEARESVARLLGAAGRDVVFTSGGTESNNAAIFGAMAGAHGQHVVTTAIEHPSVLEAVSRFDATYVAPSRDGLIDVSAMIGALRDDTRLVAMMLANNETGVIQPVAEVARVCRARGIHVHCDAVQAAGKIDVDVEQLGVDTLAVSAHKLNAPKGIGALWVRRGLALAPHVVGGAQERRRRAGTENVPLAAAFGAAAALPRADVAPLRDRLEAGLEAVIINGAGVARLPNTSSVTFPDADAEGIVIGLDLNGIAASTGSACSSGRVEPSRVLLAMGLTPDEAKSTVRFSFGRFNTVDEVEHLLDVLGEVVPRCRN